MNAVIRLFSFIAAFVFLFNISNISRSDAQDLFALDTQAIRAALAKVRAGQWSQAIGQLTAVKDPLPAKVVRWLDDTRGKGDGRFAEITDFIKNNPDWPKQEELRRRAEEAAAAEPDAKVAEWFKQYPPVSGVGKVRQAEITFNSDAQAGVAALRAAWAEAELGPSDEKSFLARHGGLIRPEDNWKRLDRELWDGRHDAARRMLPLVDADHRALAEARLALAAQAGNAEKLVEKVPAALRADPGLLYEQLCAATRKDLVDAAVKILLAQPDDPVRPELWWAQRQTIARRVLVTGNAELAYRLVKQHGELEGQAYSESQFLLGYIALRFLKNPALAFDDFAQILTRASSPYFKARAGYWGGRAATAEGKPELAAKWYAAGAEHQGTFYGQLAAHQLGTDAPPHPVPEPKPSAAETAQFEAQELVRAAELFYAEGDQAHARTFLLQMAKHAKTEIEFAMLGGLAEKWGRTDLAIAVAQRAAMADLPLTVHGYPVTRLPDGGMTEPSLLLAVVRQESMFAPTAVSSVGARGLMQLMPKTASYIAGKLRLPFSPARLEDGLFNVLLGREYLQQLIDDFGGSYALAIAGYNAGPGRVRQWIHDYGDPRGDGIGMVDWIELIPFNETRNYVQRVLENLQIYREQTGRPSAFTLVSDLAR